MKYKGIREACSRTKQIKNSEGQCVRIDFDFNDKTIISSVVQYNDASRRRGRITTLGFIKEESTMLEIENFVDMKLREYQEIKNQDIKQFMYKITIHHSKYANSKVQALATIDWDSKLKITGIQITGKNPEDILFPSVEYQTQEGKTEKWEIVEFLDPIFETEIRKNIMYTFRNMDKQKFYKNVNIKSPSLACAVSVKEYRSIKGYAALFSYSLLKISRIKIVQAKNGVEFVSMPSVTISTDGNTEFKDLVFPINKEASEMISEIILKKYKEQKK